MKKSSKLTPKEISKKRIAKSKIMKIPNNEGNFDNKENEIPPLNIKMNTHKIRDRDIKYDNFRNPYDIPNHMRLFSKSKGQRKVKPEPNIMSNPHTICDVDHTFYKIIEGRPLRQFTDVKVYMRNIRDITLFKANAAYLQDQIIQFETSNSFELEQYNQINAMYEKTKMNFVQFAKESYEIAKSIQETAEVKALVVAKITDQLESLSFHYVKLRNQLSSTLFSFETLSRYGKFLNSLSPDWWRREFDFLNIQKRTVQTNTSAKRDDVAATSVASLDEYKTSIARFMEMVPYLYFKKPKQIINFYDDLSRQCLNYMEIEAFSATFVNNVLKSRDAMKNAVKTEIEELEDYIEFYEANLKFMEQREKDYKAVFEKLLFSEFQTLYSSSDNIKLFTCVQYVYTRIFGGQEDPKDSVTTLMHGLEMLYLELTLGLDSLDLETVKAATSHMFAEDIKMMKLAYSAQRSLKECDILSKALYTSFEPPRQRKIIKPAAKEEMLEDIKNFRLRSGSAAAHTYLISTVPLHQHGSILISPSHFLFRYLSF